MSRQALQALPFRPILWSPLPCEVSGRKRRNLVQLQAMQVIGHRGAAALAPENTWESFDVALSVGVDAIETDVRATSDGVLILMHDERLERTTNGRGFVRTTPWSIIKTLDAGAWFSDAYRGAKVPLLQATLEHYGKRTHLILEIKQPHIELWVLEMVRKLRLLDVVTFTSFYFSVVRNLKTYMPAARVGFLTSDLRHEKVKRVVAAGLNQFCPPAHTVSREQVAAWKELGLEIRVWGVKDPAVMRAALDAGVDGMTVDFPHLLLQALEREK